MLSSSLLNFEVKNRHKNENNDDYNINNQIKNNMISSYLVIGKNVHGIVISLKKLSVYILLFILLNPINQEKIRISSKYHNY